VEAQPVNAPRWFRRATSAVVAAAASLPALAHACPNCAGQANGSIGQGVAVGLFILFPFAVTATVIHVIRRGDASHASAPRDGTT
jgi:hypothetical protein